MIARPSPAAPIVGASTSNRSSIMRPSTMLMRRRQKEKRLLLISIVGALFLLVCIQIFMVYPMILPNTPQLAFTSGWGAKDSHVADIVPPRRKAIRPLLETGRAPPLWTPILENSLIGYSAHWDVRELHGMKPPYVRIIATSIAFHQSGGHPHMYNDKHFKCKYYYENGTTTGDYDGQIMHFGSRESFFILCPAHALVQNGTKDVPASLYLSCEKCEGHWNYEIWGSEALSVITEGEEMERGDIAVCVRPAYGPWNNALDLIQFLIYYTQAGVNHFTFYSSRAIVPEMTKVVRKAQEIGISVEILPWNCQYSYDGYQIEEYSQYTGINACVYWQMAYYKHVAIIDLDELIAERRHFIKGPEPPEEEEDSNSNSNLLEEEKGIENEKRKEERKKRRLLKRVMVEKELTEEEVKQMKEEEKEKLIDEQKEKESLARDKWENGTRPLPELLQELNTEHPGAGAFQFLNYFFFPYEERDESLEELTLPFDLFHYTKRHGPFPSGVRSKDIIKPERVVSADIHSTNHFAGPYSEVVVDKKVASIFHYRKGNHVQSPGSVERDDEMMKFYDAVKEHPMLPALLEAVGRQANGTVFPAVKEEGEEVVEEGEEKQEEQLKKEQEQKKEEEEKEKLEQAKKEEEERKKLEQAEKEEEEKKKVEEAKKEEEERKKAEELQHQQQEEEAKRKKEEEEKKQVEEAKKKEEERKEAGEAQHQQAGEHSTQEKQAKEKEEDANKEGTMDGEKEGEKEVEKKVEKQIGEEGGKETEKEGGKDGEEGEKKQTEGEAGREEKEEVGKRKRREGIRPEQKEKEG